MDKSTPPANAPLEPTPYTTPLAMLLELRWAQALLAAAEAEPVIAHWASVEAAQAARLDALERQA